MHLLEPFSEYFSEVPHFFMSTIKYKNAIKQSRKGENEDKVTPAMATELVKLEECGCERKIKTSRPIEEGTKSLTQPRSTQSRLTELRPTQHRSTQHRPTQPSSNQAYIHHA